ncbi:response regulator [Flaviaesturariibacter amylovorans]|uniref:Response regulator n=2 Tax=Flaviaesturariibacter amylovorans TaxID=1084520 RepID=A0ABP8HBJ2_9BACT
MLVDDDATDRELFGEALQGNRPACTLTEAGNGVAALDALRAATQLPHLIVLDLNMPVMDGRETLRALRAEPAWKHIPVCILSTSSAHFDVRNAYDDGANLFLVKPLDFRSLQELATCLLALFGKYSGTV